MADNQKDIICPACGQKMTKLFIAEKSINIDICENGCGGIYFDNQEIQEFSDNSEDFGEIKALLTNKNFIAVDENQVRVCPVCNTPMVKTNAFGVQIDTCYQCGGIFLDNGEFDQIRTHFKKHKKVQPVQLTKKMDVNDIETSGINMEDFYTYQSDIGTKSLSGFSWFLNMFEIPLNR
jgi:Zn-finger nucleic acid-binding protein